MLYYEKIVNFFPPVCPYCPRSGSRTIQDVNFNILVLAQLESLPASQGGFPNKI